ncbi:dihydroorotate dehydrogenase [bacterium]|nr:dihydroorotate dehydrogenase [bacterium]
MSVEFLGRTYKTPLWVASGTFGWGVEAYEGGYFAESIGAVVSKGVSPLPMDGAPHPRIAEVNGSCAVLNAIGLQNSGVDGVISKYVPIWAGQDFPAPIWINVFAENVKGFTDVISKFVALEGNDHWLAGFELNVSCPNVDKGGAEFASDLEALKNLVSSSKKVASKFPLMVKMSPLLSSPGEVAKVCENSGADAISVSNTLLSALPEPETNKWSLGRRFGGMSGPALKPLSLRVLAQVREATKLPLCGIGGIRSKHDVQEYLCSGATVVQVGTANFSNPWVCDELL